MSNFMNYTVKAIVEEVNQIMVNPITSSDIVVIKLT